MNSDLSLLQLFSQAGLLVQLIIFVLFLVSLVSWGIIFRKGFEISREKKLVQNFEHYFFSAPDFFNAQPKVRDNLYKQGGMGRILRAGSFVFFQAQNSREGKENFLMDTVRRAMYSTFHKEVALLESSLPFLASAGSVSPYIGLLGTVLGVMNAFSGLSAVQQVTLSTVAPGISEALVTTAVGLFAAIPAFLAYNRYSTDIDSISRCFEDFIEEFSMLVQREIP